jgi:hypothetical protein
MMLMVSFDWAQFDVCSFVLGMVAAVIVLLFIASVAAHEKQRKS